MQGTFDFCDQTGGPVDYNTGTIAATITTCQFPCNIGVNEMEKNLAFNIYPNPFSNSTIIQVDGPLANATLIVYNVFGQAVKQINDISGQTITIQRDNLSAGLYFVRLMQDNRLLASDKIVITD